MCFYKVFELLHSVQYGGKEHNVKVTATEFMTKFPHDQFAKDLFEVLLSPFGTVETDRTIISEVRKIDIYFIPQDIPANPPTQKPCSLEC
jgi:hypothetical protein